MLDSQALTVPFVVPSFKFSAYILAHGLAMLAAVVLSTLMVKATRIDDCSTLRIFDLFNSEFFSSLHTSPCNIYIYVYVYIYIVGLTTCRALGIHNDSPMQQELHSCTKAARNRAHS